MTPAQKAADIISLIRLSPAFPQNIRLSVNHFCAHCTEQSDLSKGVVELFPRAQMVPKVYGHGNEARGSLGDKERAGRKRAQTRPDWSGATARGFFSLVGSASPDGHPQPLAITFMGVLLACRMSGCCKHPTMKHEVMHGTLFLIGAQSQRLYFFLTSTEKVMDSKGKA